MKDLFLSHVSHELRSPLTSIYQFVTILQDGIAGELTSEQQEYIAIILKNVNQLRVMISDLLDVTRARTGKLNVAPNCMSLADLLKESVHTHGASAAVKCIRLFMEPLSSDLTVYADPDRTRQVLTNLIENALKFTPEGGQVRITGEVYAEDADYVQVLVEDNGRGISPEGIAHIFEHLYQEPNEFDGGRRGLGIGLYICRDLITRQGGKIWVESALGKGSRFYFVLPRCCCASATE